MVEAVAFGRALMLAMSVFMVALFLTLGSADIYINDHDNWKVNSISEKAKELSIYVKWWRSASIYQIYPRSYKDTDGDGVGDLKGITDNLPYLKEIGITATWLSPIFKSPMADFGYDISNFTDIDPIFGNMDDFDALIVKANQVGVKIILDFVPNHSSDECEWFQKSIARDPEFENFYVWHPGKMVDGVRKPPSNWVSVFRGSAWQWNEQRQEYYLHQFVDKQPDFNYRNPKVREYMNDILRFWLKKGVSGFRVDAVPHVFELAPDADGNYLDEPRQEWVTDPDDYGYVNHIYTVDQPETLNLAYEWRKVLDDFRAENGGEDRILMIEAWSPIETIMKYFGNETAEGAQIPFNFFLISWLHKDSDAHHYAETINTWMDNLPKGRTSNWVMGNHDKNRIGSRMGADRMDMLNMLLLTLPGCSVTYQGEEIGMTDVWISWNDTVDPQACNSNPTVYEVMSRDPCRTPFQWNGEENSGFTTGPKTWLPVSDLYPLINVETERSFPYSHLNVYKQLQTLRNETTFREGDADIKAVSKNVLVVKRSLVNDFTYVVLLNIMDNVEVINLNAIFSDLPFELEYIVVTDRSLRRKGDITNADKIVLLPKEAAVLRATTKSSASSLFAFSLTIFLVISCINLLL